MRKYFLVPFFLPMFILAGLTENPEKEKKEEEILLLVQRAKISFRLSQHELAYKDIRCLEKMAEKHLEYREFIYEQMKKNLLFYCD